MTPAQNIMAALESKGKHVRRIGRKAEAQCPAHEDRVASLSISEGEDGRSLICCHAGCDAKDVLAAIGMSMADAFPPKNDAHQAGGNGHAAPKAYPTKAGAIEAARVSVARSENISIDQVRFAQAWDYPRAAVLRFDLPTPAGEKTRKSFRPIRRVNGGWQVGDPPGKWPLYHLDALAEAGRVYLCEGEKATDAAAAVGLAATTSAHGAKSAAKTDWKLPAETKELVILPDHDEAGEKYATEAAVLAQAANPGLRVRIVRLAALAGADFPKGGDFADFSADFRDGADADAIRAEVKAAADAAADLATSPPKQPNLALPGSSAILTCLADVQPREIKWLWPGRIPIGRLTLLVGHPGGGKSFLTTYMTANVTRGWRWPDGGGCPQGSVILVSAEDDPGDTIRPRCDAHDADAAKVQILSGVEWTGEDGERKEVVFTLANLAALESAIKSLPDLRLIVIDPIGSYLGGKADAHRDNEVRGILAPVAKLAEQYSVAVLIVAHRRKSSAGTADETALGSRAFTGIARAVWHLSRDPENKERRLFLNGKNNLAREASGLAFAIVGDGLGAHIEWEEGAVEMNADEGLAAEQSAEAEKPGPKPVIRDAAQTWLIERLADGPVEAKTMEEEAKSAKLAWRTVQRASHDLGVLVGRSGFGAPYTWRLPPSFSAQKTMPAKNEAKTTNTWQLGNLASKENAEQKRQIAHGGSMSATLDLCGGDGEHERDGGEV
jgi:hypothetical protein